MTPYLHILFIPGILTIGIYIGINIGLRIARNEQQATEHTPAAAHHAHESLPHAA